MRTSISFSGVKSVWIEHVAAGSTGNWFKMTLTDQDGRTNEVNLFGVWREIDKPYADIQWSFEGTMRDIAAAALDAALAA